MRPREPVLKRTRASPSPSKGSSSPSACEGSKPRPYGSAYVEEPGFQRRGTSEASGGGEEIKPIPELILRLTGAPSPQTSREERHYSASSPARPPAMPAQRLCQREGGNKHSAAKCVNKSPLFPRRVRITGLERDEYTLRIIPHVRRRWCYGISAPARSATLPCQNSCSPLKTITQSGGLVQYLLFQKHHHGDKSIGKQKSQMKNSRPTARCAASSPHISPSDRLHIRTSSAQKSKFT